jgi:hypothetical protein
LRSGPVFICGGTAPKAAVESPTSPNAEIAAAKAAAKSIHAFFILFKL